MKNKQEIVRNNYEKTTKILIAIISVLVVAIGVMIWMLSDLSKKKNLLLTKEQEITIEKDRLKKELEFLLEDYDLLYTQNDSLNEEINKDKEYIIELIEELSKVKNYNYQIQRKYEQELNSLRQIMRHYVYQIDSLNQLSKKLLAENIQIKDDRERIRGELDEVVHKYDELELVVEKASIVRASNIEFDFLNHRGRSVSRTRNIDRIKTAFILQANRLAEPGPRRVFLRIIRPDGYPFTDGVIMEFRESKIPYTVHRDIIYENENLPVSIYFDLTQSIIPGEYNVEIYMDKELIGKAAFIIN